MTGRDSNVIARASLAFFACLVVCIAIITVFPITGTWLPGVVMGSTSWAAHHGQHIMGSIKGK